MLILLVSMVRTFESVINEHIYFELEYKSFTSNEIKTILRKFIMDEKTGWFLNILCSKDYTQENSKSWSLLKNFIITRNFYIHYEPVTFEHHYNHIMKLSKESFRSFMICIEDCHSFINNCSSKQREDRYERVRLLKNQLNILK